MTVSESIAVVFPGQGSQRMGMAEDFVREHDAARLIFDRASATLDLDVAALCHEPDDRLHLTEFTQPCILTAEIAMLETLRQDYDLTPNFYGGHSLGEYSALVAAAVLPFETALRLVRLRGQLMQAAVPMDLGAMVAISMTEDLPLQTIRFICAEHRVDIANENSPRQVVLSGLKEGVERAAGAIEEELRGCRATWLQVSAPFHSRHMAVIEREFRQALESVRADFCANNACSVTSNTLGGFHTTDTQAIIDALTQQISGSVRWTENMQALSAQASTIIEIGPNRPLRSFFKTLGVSVRSIIDLRSTRRALAS